MNPLAELNDIHTAPAPGIWPLAPGWWLLLLLIVILTITGFYLFRYSQRHRRRKQVLGEFKRAYLDYQSHNNAGQLAIDLHQLMRRLMLATGAQHYAGLSGEAFLRYLDGDFSQKPFSKGAGRALLDAPYQQQPDIEAQPLYNAVFAWAQRQVDLVR